MALIGRILATIAVLNLISLAVFVGLATLQYESILSSLTRERLVVLAESVRGPFQTVADLGVPISTVRNADAVLERARLSDEAIVAIRVFGPNGEIVRSTTTENNAQANTETFQAAQAAGESAVWHVETSDSFTVGANVADLTGAFLGSVVIEYSKYDTIVRVQAIESRLVQLAVVVFAVSALVIFFILRHVLAEHLRIFGGILATFDGFERKFWRGENARKTEEKDVSGLGFSTATFRDLLETSEAQYRQARRKPNAGSSDSAQ